MSFWESENTFLKGIVGIGILMLILNLFSRTRAGYAAIYYSIILIIVVILLTQGRLIADLIGSIGRVT